MVNKTDLKIQMDKKNLQFKQETEKIMNYVDKIHY